MSVTETQPKVEHAFDHVHRLLTAVIDRIPWHSEQQHADALDALRQSELAIKGDDIEQSPAVVPPAVTRPGPTAAEAAVAAAGVQAAQIDYDKLAAAIVAAQAKAAAPTATAPPADAAAASAGESGSGDTTDPAQTADLPAV